MRYILILLLLLILFTVSLFYFELPFNLIRPIVQSNAVNTYAAQYNVDPLFIAAIIKVESNFFRTARSHRGAVGLMQILPSTAKELAAELEYTDFSERDLENPRINIHLGTYYISTLLREFSGNKILALAAYNAGINKVQNWYRQNPLIEIDTNDIPYPETKKYIQSVMRTYKWLKTAQELKKTIREPKTP